MRTSLHRFAAILLLPALPLCALSQSSPELTAQPASAAPAPLRAARLTFIAGTVQIQRNDNTGEDSAVLNMPLGEGTRVITGDYGQAEIEFEDGSVARLTPRSALTLDSLALDPAQVAHSELSLLGGLAYFELRKSSAATWRVVAGGTRVEPVENLTLRLAFDQPPASFAVLAGAALVERAGAFSVQVHSAETLRQDPEDPARHFLASQVLPQSWDTWNESRDQASADAADRRTSARDGYSGDQGYGWSDLDASGSWYDVPGTGQVWQPYNADEGFDPYGFGNWVWGGGSYVWASGYSWGWTPYRCGHWEFFPGFGWGWSPDPSCGRWGFAGGGSYGGSAGIFIRGNYPPRHNPILRPQPRPGGSHPVIPVRGPDGPRPPIIRRGQVRIAGSTLNPLPAVAPAASHSGSAVGQALARDFPVNRTTHQPILGVAPGTNAPVPVASRPSTPARTPRIQTDPADSTPRYVDRPHEDRNRPVPSTPGRVVPTQRTPEPSAERSTSGALQPTATPAGSFQPSAGRARTSAHPAIPKA